MIASVAETAPSEVAVTNCLRLFVRASPATNIPFLLVWQFSLAIIYPLSSKFIILEKFWFSGTRPTATNKADTSISFLFPVLSVTSILFNTSFAFNLVTLLL